MTKHYRYETETVDPLLSLLSAPFFLQSTSESHHSNAVLQTFKIPLRQLVPGGFEVTSRQVAQVRRGSAECHASQVVWGSKNHKHLLDIFQSPAPVSTAAKDTSGIHNKGNRLRAFVWKRALLPLVHHSRDFVPQDFLSCDLAVVLVTGTAMLATLVTVTPWFWSGLAKAAASVGQRLPSVTTVALRCSHISAVLLFNCIKKSMVRWLEAQCMEQSQVRCHGSLIWGSGSCKLRHQILPQVHWFPSVYSMKLGLQNI